MDEVDTEAIGGRHSGDSSKKEGQGNGLHGEVVEEEAKRRKNAANRDGVGVFIGRGKGIVGDNEARAVRN